MLERAFSGGAVADAALRTWQVAALCRALADAMDARFNPVAVQGEITGFTRASSGHCYFALKDASAQIRCVMFKRASSLLDFVPRDGQLVELRGRMSLYEPRGDLQLMVESMRQAGAGALFEQFVRLKERLELEGLFDPARKRPLPLMPRAIGVVTSLGAAALRDMVSTLRRRAPHIPVVIMPAAVQGAGAASEMARALAQLYALAGDALQPGRPVGAPAIDVILLARGGGSMEDLWAFNDEALARMIQRSPVPVVSGVGHETDFTIADFVADVRAPTPTAAAELAAASRESWLDALALADGRLRQLLWRRMDVHAQRLDGVAARLGRPSSLAAVQRFRLDALAGRIRQAATNQIQLQSQRVHGLASQVPDRLQRGLERRRLRLGHVQAQLELLDPTLVLKRGYSWLVDEQGHTLTDAGRARNGQWLHATLAEGGLDVQVRERV
jgi:exodeoxyribonuclease VII large subunit